MRPGSSRRAAVAGGGPDPVTVLALAARDGDPDAAGDLVRLTQGEVGRFLAHLTDPASAEDLAQDTYLAAFRALPAFRGDASARTWLLAIARRVAASSIRDRQRSRRHAATLAAQPRSDVPDHAGGIAVRAVVAALPLPRREAFVLTQVLGLSYDEAAGVLGVPVGTIRSRVARARDDLVAAMTPAGEAAAARPARRAAR